MSSQALLLSAAVLWTALWTACAVCDAALAQDPPQLWHDALAGAVEVKASSLSSSFITIALNNITAVIQTPAPSCPLYNQSLPWSAPLALPVTGSNLTISQSNATGTLVVGTTLFAISVFTSFGQQEVDYSYQGFAFSGPAYVLNWSVQVLAVGKVIPVPPNLVPVNGAPYRVVSDPSAIYSVDLHVTVRSNGSMPTVFAESGATAVIWSSDTATILPTATLVDARLVSANAVQLTLVAPIEYDVLLHFHGFKQSADYAFSVGVLVTPLDFGSLLMSALRQAMLNLVAAIKPYVDVAAQHIENFRL